MSVHIIDNIPFKNSLLKHFAFHDIKTQILSLITTKIPEIQKLKLNHELTEIVCNLIENLSGDDDKTKKQELAVEIIQIIFSLAPDEVVVIKQQVEYTYDNNLIYKIPVLKKYWGYIKSWITKRFL
jgi:hypothetical protein